MGSPEPVGPFKTNNALVTQVTLQREQTWLGLYSKQMEGIGQTMAMKFWLYGQKYDGSQVLHWHTMT